MTIHIENLTIDTIIGILDFERNYKQKVIVEIKIDYFYTENSFIDYSKVINLVENLFITNKYGLLEEAILDIGETILWSYRDIESLYLKISKPDIIKNSLVALSKEWNNFK